MRRFLAIFCILMLSACSQHQANSGSALNTNSSAVTQQSLDAYANSLYGFGQSQGCVSCHASNVNPMWMASDLGTAYAFARSFVDFNNPSASLFATYAGNGHCGMSLCMGSANTSLVQNLLAQWSQVELSQGNTSSGGGTGGTLANPPFVTISLPIPNPLPLITTASVSVVRFNLSQVSPSVPALAGAYLEVSIQAFNSLQNEYKIFNPRIYGNSQPITISGIHVYVRAASGSGIGIEDVNQGTLWSTLVSTVTPFAAPSPLPLGPVAGAKVLTTTTLGVQAQSAADVITIGFAAIQ